MNFEIFSRIRFLSDTSERVLTFKISLGLMKKIIIDFAATSQRFIRKSWFSLTRKAAVHRCSKKGVERNLTKFLGEACDFIKKGDS